MFVLVKKYWKFQIDNSDAFEEIYNVIIEVIAKYHMLCF